MVSRVGGWLGKGFEAVHVLNRLSFTQYGRIEGFLLYLLVVARPSPTDFNQGGDHSIQLKNRIRQRYRSNQTYDGLGLFSPSFLTALVSPLGISRRGPVL